MLTSGNSRMATPATGSNSPNHSGAGSPPITPTTRATEMSMSCFGMELNLKILTRMTNRDSLIPTNK